MKRLEDLKKEVEELYAAKNENKADWADWLYENHVLVVTDYAKQLAEKYGADEELAQVGALLHDIADIKMRRENSKHEKESLQIARDLMEKHGYGDEEIALVVDDAIRFHSCHGDEKPKSKEGLVLATADSLAHLKTDFYVFATHTLGKDSSLKEVKDWVLKKIERDLNNKIQYDDVREDARPDYEMIKELFSR